MSKDMTYNIDDLWVVYIMVLEKAIRRLPHMFLTYEDAVEAALDVVHMRDIDERVLAIVRHRYTEFTGGEGLDGIQW